MTADPAMLSALITPSLFYLGSAAVSVPIVIHLLARRRFKRIRWSAIDFLVLAEKQNRRRINLQQLILLFLRCLAVFLIGLMLARPHIRPSALADAFGSSGSRNHIFVLDDSFSMQYISGATSTFEQAKSATVSLLEALHKTAPKDRVTILTTSDPLPTLAERTVLDEAGLLAIRSSLAALQASLLPARWRDVLGQLGDELAAEPDRLNTALYIVSDFQKNDWLLAPSTADAALDTPGTPRVQGWRSHTASQGHSPLDAIKPLLEKDRVVSTYLIPASDGARPNVAVTGLRAVQPQLVATIENGAVVEISNFGSETTEPFELGVFIDDSAQSPARVPAIPPGQSVEVACDLTFGNDGVAHVRVEIPHDALGIDNNRVAAWRVQSAVRVHVINGEPNSRAIEDEVSFLHTALYPEGEVWSGFQVSVADESELALLGNLPDVHLLVLANVYRVSSEIADRLEQFVRLGGGLAIFLGDQVDLELYNERLWKDGAGLLPCPLGRTVTAPTSRETYSLQTSDDWRHPVVRVFGGTQNPLQKNVAFWQFIECVCAPDALDSASTVRIVASFDDPRQNPAIMEKTFGRGKVLLFASSADAEWNNWPKRPSYVVAMQELGHYASKRSRGQTELTAGQPIQLILDPARYLPQAILRTPSYPAEPDVMVRADPSADGATLQLVCPRADQVGVYQLLLTTTSGDREYLLRSVNLEPAESNLASCNESELRRSAPDFEFQYVTDFNAFDNRGDENLREFWPALLVAVIVLLVVEQTLACRFGRAA